MLTQGNTYNFDLNNLDDCNFLFGKHGEEVYRKGQKDKKEPHLTFVVTKVTKDSFSIETMRAEGDSRRLGVAK